MAMSVMHIRRVRMRMFETIVLVPMGMRFAYWIIWSMRMLVMLVMNVRVRVPHRIVDVFMLMALRHVQPNP